MYHKWSIFHADPGHHTARIACIDGDLSTTEGLLTRDINIDANNHTSYVYRSFVMARKQDWGHALQDAINSVSIKPSLTGYISKGIALCGKGHIRDARTAFDVASMYTNQDPQSIHFLLLIKAIALFGADQHDEANLLLKELAASCLNADIRACRVVQAYLRVQLGIKALDDARHDEAVDHFTAALNTSDPSSKLDIHEMYEDLVVGAIDLDYTSDVIFANRSKANLGKLLWKDTLLDAQKVTELNPSSHVGYQLAHAALCGAQRYDEAIDAFTIMLSKLDDAPETQIRDLRQQYVSPSEVGDTIQRAIWNELEYAPLRLLNTSAGLLCDRTAQIKAFKTSPEYIELISFPTKDSNLRTERIKDVVAIYFRCVLLSHRWKETEALLHDIQDKVVYELSGFGGIAKLQSFCKIVRDTGYRWAWMDTCCIDKKSNTELQESDNSMFVWYRHSALTIVCLYNVLPSSLSGALAKSVWNKRGWTFQEFVAPKTLIFYQKDWSLYLGDRSPNHKLSPTIMKELKDVTGIDAQAVIAFHPGMSDARQRLQWASSRTTTLQEDIAYSLFGIFGVHLPVIYGERKQNALGRLLQEIVARSGNITVLDWIGQPSKFNSCLPAYIASYITPPRIFPSLSEDEIQSTIFAAKKSHGFGFGFETLRSAR
ncbi:hypothetical protein BDR07DRAFT_1478513 [Suillus spraguei]|nr:hypothetical protein BDR07DRAFT_1478513 [Suillus spraguei]